MVNWILNVMVMDYLKVLSDTLLVETEDKVNLAKTAGI
jgi:hypothetical protein